MERKEEIIRSVFPKNCIWEEAAHIDNAPFGLIYTAMDRFAKEQASLFAVWIDRNYSQMSQKDDVWYEIGKIDQDKYSASEVYEKFLNYQASLYTEKKKY